MKYRRRPSKRTYEPRVGRLYRRAGADSPLRLYGSRDEAIDVNALFEQKRIGNGKREGFFDRLRRRVKNASAVRKRVLSTLSEWTKKFALWIIFVLSSARDRLVVFVAKRRGRVREPRDIPMLLGALVATLAVALVSATVVLYTLFLADFFGPHKRVTVPDVVGMSYEEASLMLDGKLYDVELVYEYNSSVPRGEVISQSPDAGVERKIFWRGQPCQIKMVISLGRHLIEVPDFVGMSARDASLELKNAAFSVVVVEEKSNEIPSGKVISTTPCGGEMLEVGGLVILYVSQGKERLMLLVPDVSGLTEASALAKIRAAGFTVGEVEYKSSKEVAGVVISQDRIALTKSPQGSKISITVSAGQTYLKKTVPSLYGLTVDEAREKLAEYGLVIGSVYAAESNEPSGTVIAQSPSADTVISPDIVSVDMYVSG